MSEEMRAANVENRDKQIAGGDWFRMDQQSMEDARESSQAGDNFDARTTTPLPGSRDSDLDNSALPSARHAMKDEYSDYVKLAKQGGHQGLLTNDRPASHQDTEHLGKLRISETDSEYVKMAKTGGHADLLKMDGVKNDAPLQKNPIKEHYSDYVKIAKSGGHADILKAEGVQVETVRKNTIKDTDSEYIRLAKTGGHQDLLNSEAKHDSSVSKYKVKETDSDYIKLAKTGGHVDLLATESSSPRNGQPNPRKNVVSDDDTAYVKLAKKGGNANLLKMDVNRPPSGKVNYKSNSSDWFQHDEKRALEPMTTGKGRGVRSETNNNGSQEQVQKPGKRFFQPANDRDPPFALHY